MTPPSLDQTSAADRNVGLARLIVGIAAGLSLYALHHAADLKVWPAIDVSLFAALSLTAAFSPLVLLAGAGQVRHLTMAVWFVAAASVCAVFAGFHASNALPDTDSAFPDFPSGLAAAAFLFIAHHLIVPADAGRKWIAPYPAYFDRAWLDGVQLALAIAFTGAFWLVLQIGAALFGLIGLKGFETFIHHDWFAFPATAVMFAVGVHLGDVRVGLTRGLRTVGLILLSWLLPLMGLMALAFVVALPFTGLARLWKAGAATGVLLGAMGALIILINAAYQDGENMAPAVQKWAARITALVLLPLAGVAAYGLALRVGEHGLTPQRIRAGACVLVAACYAIGYAYSAVRPGGWMRRLAATNLAVAPLILVLLAALFTPIADPVRLSVDDQIGRLQNGRAPVAKFDFRFLRFDAGQYGLAKLHGLAERALGPNAGAIRAAAENALKLENRYADDSTSGPPQFVVYPKGANLPADFMTAADVRGLEDCNSSPCDAFLVKVDPGDSDDIIVLSGGGLAMFSRDTVTGVWGRAGRMWNGNCSETLLNLRAGQATLVPVRRPALDLLAGGRRFSFMQDSPTPMACPVKPSTPSPAPRPSIAR